MKSYLFKESYINQNMVMKTEVIRREKIINLDCDILNLRYLWYQGTTSSVYIRVQKQRGKINSQFVP